MIKRIVKKGSRIVPHLFTKNMKYTKIILLKENEMNTITITKKDEIVMRLVHYFITEENYTPIIVNGVKDEVWLENSEAKYKIVRINSNYIHNNEQFAVDLFKIKNVMRQIKKKTVSLTMDTFNIFLDVNEDVKLIDDKHIKSVILKDVSDKETTKIIPFFPGIENKLLKDTKGLDLIINVTEDINKKTEKNNKIYEATFKPKKIIITYAIMAICAILFLLTYVLGSGSMNGETMYKFGAVSAPAIKMGQIWRLATGTLLHAGIIHLFVNMYSLCIIGSQLENFIGKKKFLFVYVISAISGSLMSCLFSNNLSVGASGAIFGLLGSMLYFGYHYRLFLGNVLRAQIIPIIALNLFLGFMINGIDNAAHIGGLIGGYLAMMAVGVTGKSEKNDKINGTIVLVIYIAFLIFMLFR